MDVANLAEFILPKTEPLDTDIKPSDILNKLQLASTTCASEAVTASQPLNTATALQPAQAMNGSSDPMLTIPFSPSAMAALTGGSHNDPNAVPNLSFTDVNVTLTLQELLDPTSNAEDVLAVLTPEQLTVIEKTLNKVKRRKLNSLRKTREGGVIKGKPHHPPQHIVPKPPSPTATVSTLTPQASFPPTPPATTLSDSHVPLLAYPLNLGFPQIPAALVTPPPDPTSGPVMLLPPATGTSFGGSASSPVMVSPSMTAADLLVLSQIKQEPTMSTSTASSDSALAETTVSTSPAQEQQQAHSIAAAAALSCHEPITEIKDGVEWVSFIYSHNRTLKQYSVRTDIDTVFVEELDERFKNDNCVYPRANLPRETYQGNRWAYETECNLLGWKLAWLNQHEISGKRGLIQRAVDSYRNRYPSMRSRRVARQEKLANGTLRKRKNRDGASSSNGSSGGDDEQNVKEEEEGDPGRGVKAQKIHHPHEQVHATGDRHPKTFVIDNFGRGARCRLRINVDDVNLSEIDLVFKRNNCVYPRAAFVEPGAYTGCQSRWEEECECNELGWKLAWLNPRHLANKKALLQRALDLYRAKFVPKLRPRRSSRYRSFPTSLSTSLSNFPLSVAIPPHDLAASSPSSSLHSCSSSTTDSLDFGDDLLSPPDLDNSVDVDTLLADTGSPDFEELLLMQDDDDDNEGRGAMGEEECGMGEGPMIDIERGLDGFSRTMVVAVMNHGDVTMGLGLGVGDEDDESESEGRRHQVMSHCDSGFGDLHDLVEVKAEDGDICGMGLGEEDDLTTEELLSHLLK